MLSERWQAKRDLAGRLGLALLLLSPLFFMRALEDAYVLPQRLAALLGLGLAFLGPLKSFKRQGWIFWLGMLFWSWRLLSHVSTEGPEPFLPWAVENLAPLGAFILAASAGQDPAWSRRAQRWAVLSATLVALFAVIQLLGWDPWEKGAVDFGFSHRAHGSLGNPDFLAGYLSMLLPGLVLKQWLWLPALALGLTQVRAAYAAAFIATGAVLYFQGRTLSKARSAFLLLAMAGICLVAWPRLQSIIKGEDSGFAGRRFMAEVSLSLSRQHPIMGVGPGRFQNAYLGEQGSLLGEARHAAEPYRYTADIHNDWLQVAAESGLPGLLFLGLLVGLALQRARREEAWGLFGALLAFSVQACFHFPLSIQASALLFWGSLGLLAAKEASDEEAWNWGWVLSLLFVAGAFVTFRQGVASAALNTGYVLNSQDRMAQAESVLLRAVKFWPEDSRAWMRLGLLQDRLGQGPEAVQSFHRASSLAPGLPEAWANLALALGKADSLQPAQAAAERALQLNPRSAEAWSNLAKLRYLQGDNAGALELFKQGLDQAGPSPLLWFNLGALQFNTGKKAEAKMAFEACLRLKPDHAEAARLLAGMKRVR